MPNRGLRRSWKKNRLLDDLFVPCRVFAISTDTVVCHPSTTKCCITFAGFYSHYSLHIPGWPLAFLLCAQSSLLYVSRSLGCHWHHSPIILTCPQYNHLQYYTITSAQLSWWPSYYWFECPRKKATGLQNKRVLLQFSSTLWPLFQVLELELEK